MCGLTVVCCCPPWRSAAAVVAAAAAAAAATAAATVTAAAAAARYMDLLVGPYPEAVEVYKQRSPIHSADKITVPVAILQVRLVSCWLCCHLYVDYVL
jgi:hypothetical protein